MFSAFVERERFRDRWFHGDASTEYREAAAATAARGDAALDVLDDAEEDVGGGEGIARDVGECDAVPFLRRR